MKAEYKRDLQKNYLILEVTDEIEEKGYQIQMAEKNQIPGLLSFHSSRRDGSLLLHYEITSRQTLESVYERRVLGTQDIVLLLSGIREVLESLQKYLLSPGQLIFDPAYIYVEPGRNKLYFCYFPEKEDSTPISMLAEFILRRLDHQDRQAVLLGYSFYQKALEENFSLQQALKDILAMEQKEKTSIDTTAKPGETAAREVFTEKKGDTEDWSESGTPNQKLREIYGEEYNVIHKERKKNREYREEYKDSYTAQNSAYSEGQDKTLNRKQNKEPKKENKENFEKKIDKLFQIVHPAVLLSFLLLFVALEMVFYFGFIQLTEAGGLFFLLISGELLANKFWKNSVLRRKEEENRWAEEPDEELYRLLQEEMYGMQENGEDTEIEETRCLVRKQQPEGLHLVRYGSGEHGQVLDIFIGQEPVFVGKIKQESDILLNFPTISRRHARLECQNERYYVKDLNSKNGTFLNGKRLNPQEQCEIKAGDRVAFAEFEYVAVQR